MIPFHYVDTQLWCESVPLETLAAAYGTPLYVYSASRLRENYGRIAAAFAALKPVICYAVKANSNLALMKLLQDEGAGFDIVSGGELFRALKVGADPANIVFAGVGKTEAEIEQALKAKVGWINLESEGELRRVEDVAGRLSVTARVAIRLRPDVEADTHHHISTGSVTSKFGVPVAQALEMVKAKVPNVEIKGAHIHIGSQLGSPQATLQAIEAMLGFVEAAKGLGAEITMLDIGGGFPVAYHEGETASSVEAFGALIVERLKDWRGEVHLEPGRSVVADAAALVSEVQYEKIDPAGRRIVILDAGMQTLIRPALYEAYHRSWPVIVKVDAPLSGADVAGPICESADFLARDRQLHPLASGELLALLDTGAYGFSMASNYNSHPLPAEVLVEGETHRLIRKRQTYEDLIANEVV